MRLPTPIATDERTGYPPEHRRAGGHHVQLCDIATTFPTPSRASRGAPGPVSAPAGPHRPATAPAGRSCRPAARPRGRWGVYAPAIRGWERATGRRSPRPSQPGRHGQPRLSPVWVEWLMGLPPGWVSDVAIPPRAQLRALGNGVVPAQAALALRLLLDDLTDLADLTPLAERAEPADTPRTPGGTDDARHADGARATDGAAGRGAAS